MKKLTELPLVLRRLAPPNPLVHQTFNLEPNQESTAHGTQAHDTRQGNVPARSLLRQRHAISLQATTVRCGLCHFVIALVSEYPLVELDLVPVGNLHLFPHTRSSGGLT